VGATRILPPAEGKVLLHGIRWETYERMLEDKGERSVPRFFYDRGELELVSPSRKHENIGRIVTLLVGELAVELEMDVFDAGHTTFKREDLDRGFEPDGSFYFSENARLVRDRDEVDLDVEPPPDLVVEVDITSLSLNKLPTYWALGVPEVWRHDGRRLTILTRQPDERYAEAGGSGLLPGVTGEALTRLVADGLSMERPAWARRVRGWARELRREPRPS